MNKLSVEGMHKTIKACEYEIDTLSNAQMTIEGNTIFHSVNTAKDFEIILDNNANLTFYQVKEVDSDIHITFTIKEQARLEYNLLLLNRGHNNVTIDTTMPNNGAYANIKVRVINISNNSNLNLVVNGRISESTKDNELIEDLKGLIIGDNDIIKISPNMMVDTNEVLANHLVTIGPFNKEELFYLTMRGLSIDSAKELLKKAFLTNIMSDYEKEKMEVNNIA